MLAPVLFSQANLARNASVAQISDEQQFFNDATKYFVFWRAILKKGYQAFGGSLDPEWVSTALFYCNCGTEAIERHSAKEAIIFAKQLDACISLGRARGVFVLPFCPLEPTKLLVSAS